MNLIPWRRKDEGEERSSYPLSMAQWAQQMVNYQGIFYNLNQQQTLTGNTESIASNFTGLVHGAYEANGIVFACMLTRMLHFQQARMQFQQFRNGKPGDLFGTPELGILEKPWVQGTTMDLLARMIQDVDLSGNFYAVRQGNQLVRLRPDWTFIVLGSRTNNPDWEVDDDDTVVIGYEYYPGGLHSGREGQRYLKEQVVHWAPVKDPLAWYRGISWLTPVIREIEADASMTTHRQKFFEKGATVNHVYKIPVPADNAAFQKWVEVLKDGHESVANAYASVYLGAGADMTAIGSDMQQIDFAIVQGAGETRIAMAARIPPTILGNSEGLKGSTLNAGNYASARRNFADGLLHPLWGSAAGALATVIRMPKDARLWYDIRDIPFLKEDVKDAAEIRRIDSETVRNLLDSGFKPDAALKFILGDDLGLLVGQHSGLFSVQLQPPNTGGTASNSGGTFNGGTV